MIDQKDRSQSQLRDEMNDGCITKLPTNCTYTRIFHMIHFPPPRCSGLLAYCLGIMIGCRLARANDSAVVGEIPSVRITLPMDMKKLWRFEVLALWYVHEELEAIQYWGKSRERTQK